MWLDSSIPYNYLTNQTAVFDLIFDVPLAKNIHFPNWVVALKEDSQTGKYRWIVEYQCIAAMGVQEFIGLNIYHREQYPD